MKAFVFLLTVLMISTVCISQNQISGVVLDSNTRAPIAGASVYIQGTKTGATTKTDGTFSLESSSPAILVVTNIGYSNRIVYNARPGENISVSLESNSRSLSEVIVTALNIRREKRSLTYATETINTDQLNKSGTGNPLSELEGKASGLTVINSTGDPGGGTYIRLRGVTSITGDNQPLIVVDGIPIDNSINNYDPTSATPNNVGGASGNLTGGTIPTNRGIDINPSDIESITVLKGPAATALYGIKAASGALIITTKKGNYGAQKIKISLNSSATIDKANRLPDLQDKFAQGSDGIYAGPTGNANRRLTWGPAIDTLYFDGDANIWDPNGNIVGQSDPLAGKKVTPYDRYEFFKTGFTLNNNIALSGGSDNTSFRISLGNTRQNGIIPKTRYNKTSAGISGQAKLNSKLTVVGSLNYIVSANDKVQQGSNTSGIMLGLLRTPPTFDNSFGLAHAQENEDAYVVAATGGQRNYRGGAGYDNPYWTVNRNPFKENLNRAYGNIQATYEFAKWISVVYRVGGDAYAQDSKNFYDINSNAFPAGKAIISEYFNNQYNSDLTVNMERTFNQVKGNLLVGHNYFYNSAHSRTTLGDGLIAPKFFDIQNALSYSAQEADGIKRTNAFYAEAQANYRNMLFLNLTGRTETSSSLPKSNRNFFYPSAGAGFVFTELTPLKGMSVLSFGKLRLSYAQVGKDAPIQGLGTPYAATNIADGFTPGIQFPIVVLVNGVPTPVGSYQVTSTTSVIGNSELKPEKTSSYEAGLDIGFLRNKINFSATYYHSKTTDAIFTVPYAYSTGYASSLLNAGEIVNKGIELSVNATPVNNRNLKWDINLNWSHNSNNVAKLYNGVNKILIAGFQNGEIDAFAGQPFGQIYGSVFVRANAGTGDVKVANGTDVLLINDNPADPGYGKPQVATQNAILGDINPKWIGSFTNNITYKNISLGFQIDIRHKGDIWNGTRGALSYFGTSKETENRGSTTVFSGMAGHLDGSGNVVHFDTDGVTEIPGPGGNNTVSTILDQFYWQNIGSSFIGPSESSVEDGSFVKLRQISLGYNFPKSLIGKAFNNLSLTFFANNIILWTKYHGVDPETSLAGPSNGQGLDYFNNPAAKSFGVRLNVGL